MISLQKNQQGFTILELLVVTLFIIILGVLMFNSLADVKAKGLDNERRGDITIVAQQLEFYHNISDTSLYPTLDNLKDSDWVKENLRGLEEDALTDPAGIKLGTAGSDYAYTPEKCTEKGCGSFTLTANMQKSTPDPYTKKSINQ